MRETNEVWLLFREGNHPLRKLLKKGFGHVYLLMKDNLGFWVLIDPADSILNFVVLKYKPEEDAPRILMHKKNAKVLKIRVQDPKKRMQGINFLNVVNCVSIIKYALGMRLFAFTPWQLYKKLLKMENTKHYKQSICSVTQLI